MTTRGHHGLLFADAAPPPSGSYLDAISPAPRAVFSIRKLISTATVALRVRRSSDNTEQDIGFSGDALDTTALASFVGAGSGFVATFYDQTGNGFNTTGIADSLEPRIVNAGVYDDGIVFDGSNDYFPIPSLTMGTNYAGVYLKLICPDVTGPVIVFETSSQYNLNAGSITLFVDGNRWFAGLQSAGSAQGRYYNPTSITTMQQMSVLYQLATADGTVAQQRMWIGGSSITQDSRVGSGSSVPANFTTFNSFVGRRNGATLAASMTLDSLVIYNSDTDSARASIEAIVA